MPIRAAECANRQQIDHPIDGDGVLSPGVGHHRVVSDERTNASWTGVTIDCVDPARLARFWSDLLGRPRTAEMDAPGWASVGSRHDTAPRLTFRAVPEARAGKVRIHLDVSVGDVEEARRRIEALGGSWAGVRHDYDEGSVLTMCDPEGNEFCIVSYAER
ncbi:hypothetical protein GCM10009762_13210 [Dermacoccus barathri]|uniref:VOC domain-containing protein n=1 Tax=Dermacoccus barathri TaxID=322601 RepID=A0ABN2BJ44_9MICO